MQTKSESGPRCGSMGAHLLASATCDRAPVTRCDDGCSWKGDIGTRNWRRDLFDSCLRPCRMVEARIDALVIAYLVEWRRDTPGTECRAAAADEAARRRAERAARGVSRAASARADVEIEADPEVVGYVDGAPGVASAPGIVRALHRAAKWARKHGRGAPFAWGEPAEDGRPLVRGELRVPTQPGKYTIENAECTIRIDRDAAEMTPEGVVEPSWNLEIEWRAASLATRGPDVNLSYAIAASFGRVRKERLRRFDAAVTCTGWRLCTADADALVLRSRAKVDRYAVADAGGRCKATAQAHLAVHMRGRARMTGFSVSPGNPVMCRVYDKVAELVAHGEWRVDRHGRIVPAKVGGKGPIEMATAVAAGADPNLGNDLVRVEFQVRGEALDEMGLRDPRDLERRLAEVWAYLTGEVDAEKPPEKGAWGWCREAAPSKHKGWMRMVKAERASRARRAELDPRWVIVREAFARPLAKPVVRKRIRRGADYRQVFGAAISHLAATGDLPLLPILRHEGRVLEPHEAAEHLTETSCVLWAQHQVERTFTALGREVAIAMLADKGPRATVEWIGTRYASVRERFDAMAWDTELTRYAVAVSTGKHPLQMTRKELAMMPRRPSRPGVNPYFGAIAGAA